MIKYPLTATTNASKYAFIDRALELLRHERNIMGKWYSEGITLIQYQKLRADVQIMFPYTEGKLNKNLWDKYLQERYEVKTNVLYNSQSALKEALFKSTRFSPNIDSDIS